MHILSYLFRLDPENEGPSCLKGACGCVNTNIKSARATFFNYFFKKQSFKKSHLNATEGVVQWTPTLIFSEVGHGKTKPNRWLERSPKMRNLHRCHCKQKFSKYEKTRKTYRLGSNGPPP